MSEAMALPLGAVEGIHSSTPEFFQFGGGVDSRAVDVKVCAEFLSQGFAFFAAADAHHLISKLIRELNAKVAEATDAEDSHEVAGD